MIRFLPSHLGSRYTEVVWWDKEADVISRNTTHKELLQRFGAYMVLADMVRSMLKHLERGRD